MKSFSDIKEKSRQAQRELTEQITSLHILYIFSKRELRARNLKETHLGEEFGSFRSRMKTGNVGGVRMQRHLITYIKIDRMPHVV